MGKKKEPKNREKLQLESQDDEAYLTSQHSTQDQEKQIKSPTPRRSNKAVKPRRQKEGEDGQD